MYIILFPGYNIHFCERGGDQKKGGGLCVIWKENVNLLPWDFEVPKGKEHDVSILEISDGKELALKSNLQLSALATKSSNCAAQPRSFFKYIS